MSPPTLSPNIRWPQAMTARQHGDPVPFKLPSACVHELFSASTADGACVAGLALATTAASSGKSMLWVRQAFLNDETGALYPRGLSEFGIDPAQIILVPAKDMSAALQAGLEGARCTGLGTVLIELWGEAKAYDLTASRRLSLAAKASGTTVLVGRIGAEPRPSAAETRWRIRSSPSRALAANAPGNPAFELTLLRARNGQEGLRYRVEWDRDVRELVSPPVATLAAAPANFAGGSPLRTTGVTPLSRAVVPVSVDRAGAARDGSSQQRRAG